ncbi:hypothetical protein EY643_02900 [Halioglobus maricola]|uniref:Uncharacterized protein n=1 Tax=Halioglobus maricola TaxID=2601894 RepID=A0A5P9NGL0_9GAMM|nr:hypothetical protein [Halioglobus maricola]QFU74686.1 hypothetical protein EY643_02900 [Halioglobus maricola]
MHLLVIGCKEHEGGMLGELAEYISDLTIIYHDHLGEDVDLSEISAVLVSQEWKESTRMSIKCAQDSGLPVVYLMDGVIEWDYVWNNQSFVRPERATVLQPLLSDFLCVIGQHPARILAGLGLTEKIRLVGIPRLDASPRTSQSIASNKPSVLVTTAKTASHNVAQDIAVVEALQDLQDYFSNQAEVDVVWRVDAGLAQRLGIPASASSMEEDLHVASGVISFTSTCLLESMLMQIPTAQVDYRSCPGYVTTAWNIHSKKDIASVVQELLYPPENMMAYQSLCLEDELTNAGAATEALAAVLREACAGQLKEQSRYVVAPEFPGAAMDFRRAHPQISSFSVADGAKVQYLLDAAYRLQQKQRALLTTPPFKILRILVGLFGWLPGFRKAAKLQQDLDKM